MKRKSTTLLTLPNELIVEILLRLPVKSVLLSKCVCKSWLSLISDPQFAKSHFDMAAAPIYRLILQRPLLLFANRYSLVNSVDIEAPLHDNSTKVVFNILFPVCVSKHGIVDIVGSCRGFILLKIDLERGFIDFVIWNPSTGLRKQIKSNVLASTQTKLCGFGYDSSADDYVVVVVKLSHQCTVVDCFSLRTNSWSVTAECSSSVAYYCLKARFEHGELLNGVLHWFVVSYDRGGVILAFDVKERRLSEIPLPNNLAVGSESQIYHFKVLAECLCFCMVDYRNGDSMYEMWMMKEYKVQSSWNKSFALSSYGLPDLSFPICFTKNGEILGSSGFGTLARYNDKGELLENRLYEQYIGSYSLIHCGVYRESLLSLPEEFEKPSEDDDQQ